LSSGAENTNSAPDDDQYWREEKVDFQINGETYFVNLGEHAGWQVLVSTPDGAREIPVYEDAPESDDVTVVLEDERRRRIPN
jgi:hypothetical protein